MHDVSAWWIAENKNSSQVEYTIVHSGGTNVVVQNQKVNGGQWNLLGTYSGIQYVEVNAANGNTVADAIQFTESPYNPPYYVSIDATAYIHADHLGTPRQATDDTGTVVWRWDSTPFGDSGPDEDPDGDSTNVTLNLRFPGQYYDEESGLHYNYFRNYDPDTGRYFESDPIGLIGGMNTFSYVINDPISLTDPRGLDFWMDNAVPSESGWGYHQSVCVGKPDGERLCISFGRKPGQGDCLFDCKGHVYRDRKPGPIVQNRYRYTDESTDRLIRDDLEQRIGTQGRWDVLGGENCREFSENLFQELVSTYGGRVGAPPDYTPPELSKAK